MAPDVEAAGWPGARWIEGRTRVHLPRTPTSAANRRDPATADTAVFHNPAMGRCRTRSVRLLQHVLESGWLGRRGVHVLDGLSASGLRARRWLTELPAELAARLHVTLCERDPTAAAWARANLDTHDDGARAASVDLVIDDLRAHLPDRGYQWIDLDPYGSPAPFLDAAIQATSRRAVLELTATDTAALCGTSAAACRRRYGLLPRNDERAHDTGLRLLMAATALNAARHDRTIAPLHASWDGHHLRVSVTIRRSLEQAGLVHQRLGWSVADPTPAERATAAAAGLLHPDDADPALPDHLVPAHILLPHDQPPTRLDGRVAGPLWIGPLHDPAALRALDTATTLDACALSTRPSVARPSDLESVAWAGFSEADIRLSRREIERAVHRCADQADVLAAAEASDAPGPAHLVLTNLLARRTLLAGPPSPKALAAALTEQGIPATQAHWGEPAILTVGSWRQCHETAAALMGIGGPARD